MTEALPLWEAEAACYYGKSNLRRGWSPEDFKQEQEAVNWQPPQQAKILAVPFGYFKLPNADWVSGLAAELTPWKAGVVAAWQKSIEKDIWLTILRLYHFSPVQPEFLKSRGFHLRVNPFHVDGLQVILPEKVFQERVNLVQMAVERNAITKVYSEGGAVGKNTHAYNRQDFTEETGYKAKQLEDWVAQIQRKKQLIFQGPPGTGKTYLAERIARYITEQDGGHSELVQFHASYAYEDFVQGIRPLLEGRGELRYELAEGRFLKFCRNARTLKGKACVLVIDEINRADLARVFGELMYLLEYRDREILLSGGGAPFSIPSNVYLIGTMNTADRSIAPVDLAMRRRFRFIRLCPDYQLLAKHLKQCGLPHVDFLALLQKINRMIGDEDCALGISFFLVDDLKRSLADIWSGEIEPYLEEVLFDRPKEMDSFRWSKIAPELKRAWDGWDDATI
ncbi:MAG: AAA domain-containing protein [Gemmatimonadetes bacterium]|nr:AAA domain-containing protein [Gemmatimonadota bacterium]MBT5804682.1 AAA domain-containing protein [Gemmatimonadota bacterium]MBT6906437.1 AAA domain-containing protein [Gemmatimonadota bacterium]MBT7417143.1 AAA domain-containing protein [Gemmatimonadota bacterium]